MRLTKEEFLNGVQKIQQMHEEEHIIIDVLDMSPEWVCGNWWWNYYELLNKMCDLPKNDLFHFFLFVVCIIFLLFVI